MTDNSSLPLPGRGGFGADDEPVFSAPWQATVFALTVRLHERGAFSWPEWSERLGAALAEREHAAPTADTYYSAWLAAFEALVLERNIAAPAELRALTQDWLEADRATPHGEPVLLKPRASSQLP